MRHDHPRLLESDLAVFYRLMDIVVIVTILWAAVMIRGVEWSDIYTLVATLATAGYYLFAQANHVYGNWRTTTWKDSLWPVFLSWLLTMFMLLFLGYVTKRTGEFSRIAMSAWILLVPFVMVTWRYAVWRAIRLMRLRGYNLHNVAIAGITDKADELSWYIEQSPTTGMKLVGFFDDTNPQDGRNPQYGKFAPAGDFEALIARVRGREVDTVFIALPLQRSDCLAQLLGRLSDTTASVYYVPDLLAIGILGARWIKIGQMTAVSVYETPFHGIDSLAKRVEDIVLGALILPIIVVPMLLIALGIKLTSSGPVFFRQQRYGLDGQKIRIWKFRTMVCCEDDERVVQATQQDPRVTRFGSFLRHTSLDELPQFINVLAGDMSVVGPRPHAVVHNEQYRKQIRGYMLRHKVKPGITGWAQVNGWRGETDSLDKMEKRIEHDLWYIHNWSLMLDLRLVVKTVLMGFRGRNAY